MHIRYYARAEKAAKIAKGVAAAPFRVPMFVITKTGKYVLFKPAALSFKGPPSPAPPAHPPGALST